MVTSRMPAAAGRARTTTVADTLRLVAVPDPQGRVATARSLRVSTALADIGRVVELSLLLVRIKLSLRRHGLHRTATRCTAVRERRWWPGVSDERHLALHGATLTRAVARWLPLPGKCLEHSLLVSWFLARRGLTPEVVIAGRKYPFAAHAWTRWDGHDLSDPPEEHPDHFRVISRYGGSPR